MKLTGESVKGQFLGASAILLGLGDGRALSAPYATALRAVADGLHEADAWRKYCEGKAPCTTDEDARVTYNLVRKSLGAVNSTDGLNAKWNEVRTVACTICAVAGGAQVKTTALHAAIRLCQKIGMVGQEKAVSLACETFQQQMRDVRWN